MANILCIEPDRVLVEVYYHALTSDGHDVVVTPSAQTGLMVADGLKPDLIILELQLIEHSGVEFLYELRSYDDWRHVPVIIQTQVPPAELSRSHKLIKDQLNVAQYLYKPDTTLKQLKSTVSRVIPVPS